MRRTRAIRGGGLAALASLALWGAAPAGAEPVLELGHGRESSAVTDAAGTLHAVWRDPTSTPISEPMLYCRVAAGGNACTPTQLTTDVRGAPRLFVRSQDGALIIIFPGNSSATSTNHAPSCSGNERTMSRDSPLV